MPEIEVLTSNGELRRLQITDQKMIIGRGVESDVVLSDQLLSRRHAEIGQRAGGFYLVDLRSTNGTFINGERVVGERRLRHGDLIAVGQTRLVFSEGVASSPDVADGAVLVGAQSYTIQDLQSRVTSRAMEVVDLARQTRVFQLLGMASSSLLGNRPLPELFERALDVVFEAIPVQRGAIALLDPRTGAPQIRAARSLLDDPITRVSIAISRRVVDQRVALLIPNVFEDSALRDRESILSTGLRSAICAPLWLAPTGGTTEEVIGLIYGDTRDTGRPFRRDDLEILTALANIAASKIESGRLQEMNAEKERLEREMRAAADIQRSILPSHAPPVPSCELDGESRSCDAVGGDYHDFHWDGQRLSITVADVSGKGLGAAMLMTSLRTAVHAHWRDTALASVAVLINRTFFENVPVDRYATCFLARFDPHTGRLTYVSAGHPPPLLVRASGTVEPLRTGGPGLGLFDAVEFEEGDTTLDPGDTLVAYSDGVTESWPSPETAEAILIDLTRSHAGAPVSSLRQAILAAVDGQNRGVRKDDCTVVVLRWSPGAPPGPA
jgi:serine phosphatase RsbU (regulator of sigma subunit)/pSer/pThr/pTyr-binding forkhead associated (FHA) protein